jgi:hypothetical protein
VDIVPIPGATDARLALVAAIVSALAATATAGVIIDPSGALNVFPGLTVNTAVRSVVIFTPLPGLITWTVRDAFTSPNCHTRVAHPPRGI